MPQYKVLKRFRDSHTKDIYEIDQEIEMTKKRAAEVEKNLDNTFLEILEKVDPITKDDQENQEDPKIKEPAENEKEKTKVAEEEAK